MTSESARASDKSLFIDGPTGPLEALFWPAATGERPPVAAVVCHPHPLYGGTMHNKVAYRAAKTLRGFAVPVLRFNFRGVGMSAGVYGHGLGEEEDARAAMDWVARECPGVPLLAIGFSFGAWVGLRVGCADSRVTELVGLGLPVNSSSLDFAYLRTCSKPKLLLWGERDEYAAREKVEALLASFPKDVAENVRVALVPGADHFFTGRLEDMTRELAGWFRERHPEPYRGDL